MDCDDDEADSAAAAAVGEDAFPRGVEPAVSAPLVASVAVALVAPAPAPAPVAPVVALPPSAAVVVEPVVVGVSARPDAGVGTV